MLSQRLRFCEAAMACFRRKGVAATNLTDICVETGLSMGALYKHFPNRDALLSAVFDLRLSQRNDALRGRTWKELRRALLAARSDQGSDSFWREFSAMADWNEALQEIRVRQFQSALKYLSGQIAEFTAAGEIRPHFDPIRTTHLISLIFDGSAIAIRLANESLFNPKDIGEYLDFAVGAIDPPAAG
jgi:AcrR family transcriptional regulator